MVKRCAETAPLSRMPSSRLTEDGRVVVTTPCTWCEVGHELYVIGSAAEYVIDRSDWVRRLLQPPPPPSLRRVNEVDVRRGEALLEQLYSGEIHPALVAEPL
jgi:hypothetical protein